MSDDIIKDYKKNFEKEFHGKTIMITGGLGFIGSNLAIKLPILNPKKIIIVDSLVEGLGGNLENLNEIKHLENIEIYSGLDWDIKNIIKIKPLIEQSDIIFNLAGSGKHTKFGEKELHFDTNINFISQALFLESCRQVMTENPDKKLKIIFGGTRDQYGKVNQEHLPVREDYLPKKLTDYQSISKNAIESHHLILNNNLREQGIDIKINSLRITNTYGPKQSTKASAVFPVFIEKAIKNEVIELWGGGDVLRDFNYVDDVIEAFFLLASSEINGQIYNLGCCLGKSGIENPIGNNLITIRKLAEFIVNIAKKGQIKIISYPKEKESIEPGHFTADITKIHTELGWKPETSLIEGIKKTIDYHGKNYNNQTIPIIPFLNLKKQHESLKSEIENAINKVIENSNFILGEEGKLFEQEFANYCNKKYGIGVNSGTDALKLALKAFDIKTSDEVIIPVNTAIPTAMAIKDIGAEPCFVDINENYLIDANKIEEKITKKTKAIIPVHLYGQACDMDRILEIARKYNLIVIEDCCQSHGTSYKGKKVPISDIGCFSFYPSKNLGCLGDGGMIITNNEDIKNKLVLLRNYGQKDKYNTDILGINSRLDELQAAILRVKLKHLDNFNEKRKKIAFLYNNLLEELDPRYIKLPNYNSEHIYHLYVIRTRERDSLMNYLKEKNINTLIHYPIPLHLQNAFSYLGYKIGDFPNTEKFSKEILSLPMYPELKEDEVRKVCQEIKSYFGY